MTALWGILTAIILVLFWAWLLHEQRNRVRVLLTRREALREEMKKATLAFQQISDALGTPLVEATRRATVAMQEFRRAFLSAAEAEERLRRGENT